jgi:hypothetical protein
VQENRHAREPNHEHASMPEALYLDPTRKVRSQPTNEDGHPRTLYGERQGAEDGGGGLHSPLDHLLHLIAISRKVRAGASVLRRKRCQVSCVM